MGALGMPKIIESVELSSTQRFSAIHTIIENQCPKGDLKSLQTRSVAAAILRSWRIIFRGVEVGTERGIKNCVSS